MNPNIYLTIHHKAVFRTFSGLLAGLCLMLSSVNYTAAQCAFPVIVTNEAQLNAAIICYNAVGTAGTYDIVLGTNILLTASTQQINNSTSGVQLLIRGGGFTVNAQVPAPSTTIRRPFNIAANTHVTMENLTIANGNAGACNSISCDGGGIMNRGTLVLNNVTLSGNRARTGAGVYTFLGNLTMSNSNVTGNTAGNGGGGMALLGAGTVEFSTFSNNTVTSATAGIGGGIQVNPNSTLALNNSTVSGNQARTGAGIYATGPTTVVNSTISGNTATNLGGGAYGADGVLSFTNSTVANNSAGNGGAGIFAAFGAVELGNTILASASGNNCGVGTTNMSFQINSNGNNISSDGSCSLAGSGDMNQTDPKLSMLADFGGPTQTHALLLGSPAHNAGNDALIPPGTTDDQRGNGFPRVIGANVDIGASELNCTVAVTCYADDDGDSYGDPDSEEAFCLTCPPGYVSNSDDCDDSNPLVNPTTVWYQDADGDGHSSGLTLTQCEQPVGYQLAGDLIATSGDCNDNNAAVYPGADEICDGLDNNCNGLVDENHLPGGGWSNDNVGGSGVNGTAEISCGPGNNATFNVSAMGYSTSYSDQLHLVHFQLCGDGEIIARVLSVQNGGWAGITMREGLAAGARKVAMKTQLSTYVRREIRTATNGPTNTSQMFRPQHVWLRLVRTGNNFTGYTSTNGSSWTFGFSTSVSMASCLNVGVFTESINVNTTTTASFSNLTITGALLPLVGGPMPNSINSETLVPILDVSVFPNPTTGEVNLKFSEAPEQGVSIQVFNALGESLLLREVDSMETLTERLDLSGMASGIYFIQIHSPDYEPLTKRVILNNVFRP